MLIEHGQEMAGNLTLRISAQPAASSLRRKKEAGGRGVLRGLTKVLDISGKRMEKQTRPDFGNMPDTENWNSLLKTSPAHAYIAPKTDELEMIEGFLSQFFKCSGSGVKNFSLIAKSRRSLRRYSNRQKVVPGWCWAELVRGRVACRALYRPSTGRWIGNFDSIAICARRILRLEGASNPDGCGEVPDQP